MTALVRAIEGLEGCDDEEEEDENHQASMTNAYILVAAGAKLDTQVRITARCHGRIGGSTGRCEKDGAVQA